jgi:CubicO group peptidase (beta-lactamase class C family)
MVAEPTEASPLDPLARALDVDERYAHTTNLVVRRDGQEVLVLHRGGGSLDDLVDTYSVTKSVLSTLVGIALARGDLDDLDRPVAGARTFRHLLTMTGGTRADGPWEIDEVMARPEGWVEFLAAAPARDPPGARFRYDNGAAHVLGWGLAQAVGMSLGDYARAQLFAPLGIVRFEWPADPEGHLYGFGHLRLAPRDLARLGELWRAGGEGLLDPAYARAATSPQSAGGPPEDVAYGFLWWVADDSFFAGGYAGQSLVVAPARGLVAVTTGEEARLRPGWRNARHLVAQHLL